MMPGSREDAGNKKMKRRENKEIVRSATEDGKKEKKRKKSKRKWRMANKNERQRQTRGNAGGHLGWRGCIHHIGTILE